MYHTLQDISLACCTGMLCVGIFIMVFFSSIVKRLLKGFGGVVAGGGIMSLLNLDILGDLLGMVTGGGDDDFDGGGGRRGRRR